MPYLIEGMSDEVDFSHAGNHDSFIQIDTWIFFMKDFRPVIKYFNAATDFMFYCDAKHSDTLQESSHVSCYFFEI